MNKLLLELAKERYLHEIDRIDRLNNSLSVPIAIASILSGALVAFNEFCGRYDLYSASAAFIILASIFLFFLILSYYFLSQCFFNSYWHLALPAQWESFAQELEVYYTGNKIAAATTPWESILEDELYKQYRDYATAAYNANNAKNDFIVKAKLTLVAAVVFGFLSGCVNFYDKFTGRLVETSKPVRVELVQERWTNMNNNNTNEKQQQNQPKPAPTGQQSPRPTAPSGQMITEGLKPKPVAPSGQSQIHSKIPRK